MVKTFERFTEIRRMWNAAYQALVDAESILFFGFSFPQTDALIGEVFRATLGRSSKLQRIAIVDLEPMQILDRLKRFLVPNHTIEVTPLRATNDHGWPSWIEMRPTIASQLTI